MQKKLSQPQPARSNVALRPVSDDNGETMINLHLRRLRRRAEHIRQLRTERRTDGEDGVVAAQNLARLVCHGLWRRRMETLG
jgi:hypothetical protein